MPGSQHVTRHVLSASEIARVCHEANRALQAILGEQISPPWDGAPEWMRDSAHEGVGGVLAGNTPEQSHAQWMANRLLHGWRWAPVKDEVARTHPSLVPYEELPPEQKLKDALFVAVVQSLGHFPAAE